MTPSPPPSTPAAKAHHARAILVAQREHEVDLTFPGADYRLTLKTYQPVSTPIGKRVVGIIQARARRIDSVRTGGSYVEPIYGQPRRIQGEVLDTDTSARTITVHAGAAPFVCTVGAGQKTDAFKPGDFVALDVLEGTSFSQV